MKRKIKKTVKSILCTCASMCTPFLRKQSMLNPHTARDILDRYQPKPAGTADGCNTLLDPTCDLQIVVPAYNVEKYLAACMDSILNQQTKYTYKVVLVDDGATDQTPQIADRYADDERVMVIHQENRGLSGARNQALNRLTGKYMSMVGPVLGTEPCS